MQPKAKILIELLSICFIDNTDFVLCMADMSKSGGGGGGGGRGQLPSTVPLLHQCDKPLNQNLMLNFSSQSVKITYVICAHGRQSPMVVVRIE